MRTWLRFNYKKIFGFSLVAFVATAIFIASLFFASYVADNGAAQSMVSQFGYLGVLVIGIVTGLNVIIPVPGATFAPVFLAAGLSMSLIIVALTVGTTIADMIGYYIGRWSKEITEEHYPKTYARLLSLNENHHNLLLPFLFLYAVFSPFPNEIVIIPLAMMGLKLHKILITVLLGNFVYQTAIAYGATSVFDLFF